MVLGCGFDIKNLPIKLPKFYEECFQIFAEHSAATSVKEEVMSVARKELKDKVFSMYDDIPKDLYDLRKQQQKKFKQARDKGYRVYFSKAHPDQLFVNGKFLPPDQPLE